MLGVIGIVAQFGFLMEYRRYLGPGKDSGRATGTFGRTWIFCVTGMLRMGMPFGFVGLVRFREGG